jgi:hypothetical protein
MPKGHVVLACLLASFTSAGAASGQSWTPPDRADARPVRVAGIDPTTVTDATAPRPRDAAAPAKEWIKGYQLEMGVASTYVFRGAPVYVDRYDPSSQLTASVTLDKLGPGSLTLTAWNATALARFEGQPGTAVEIDLSATYTLQLTKAVSVGLGYLVMTYPKRLEGTPVDGGHEISATVAYDNKYVTPRFTVNGEVVRMQGVYASLAGSHAFELGPVTLTPQASLGVAGYRKLPFQANDATASLSAQWAFSGVSYVALRGAVSYLLGRSSALPEDERSPSGRTIPVAMLAVGVQK